jgi:peptide/nickel transport system permease protein
VIQAREAPRGRGPWELVFERLRSDRAAVFSFALIVLIVSIALSAPLIASVVGHPPDAQYRDTGLSLAGVPVGPSGEFLFGADALGRDVLVRVVYGARVSLFAGVFASLLAVTVGVMVGLSAGYFGGVVDTALSRILDVVLSLPFLVLAIALVSVVGPSLTISIGVIAFFSWASVGRVVRGQTLSIKESEYVQAARLLGAGPVRIMLVEILPNVLAPVIVYATLLVPTAIVFEATLSFLGLGVLPPTPTWGNMLAEAITYYRVAWWYVVFPGAALFVTTLAFNVLGDSVRDAVDPRHESIFAGVAAPARAEPPTAPSTTPLEAGEQAPSPSIPTGPGPGGL